MRAAAAVEPDLVEPRAPRILGVGVVTGWGEGVEGLPDAASHLGERDRGLVTAPTPVLDGDRFRRATRECLFAVAAAKAAVADAGLGETDLTGPRTGILYVSATGYAAANRAFLEDERSTTLHFPYTSPSTVPGEVTIEFGIRGPFVNLMGGAPATLLALWSAARWLTEGRADRVLVIAVEAFHEVWDLFRRARRLYDGPLIEGAACLLLDAGESGALRWRSALAGPSGAGRTVATVLREVLDGAAPRLVWSAATGAGRAAAEARVLDEWGTVATMPRLGEALAMGPLIALARARQERTPPPWLLTATWRSEYAALLWTR